MMFMIPMPPTISEIEAMPPSSSVSVPLIDDAVSSSWAWSKIEKSSSSVAASSWRVRRSAGDLGLHRVHLRLVGDADADRPDAVAGDEVLVHDADRDHDLVVGILEPGAALGLEDADQAERQAADRDLAADGASRRA